MKTCVSGYKDIYLNCESSVYITAGFDVFYSVFQDNYFNNFVAIKR